jgi:hypothetical protein
LLSVVLLASMAGLPGICSAANDWTAELPIQGTISNPQGGFLLLLPASNPACSSSGNQFNVYVGVNSVTADGAKAALALAMTAYAMGKPVVVLFDSAIAGCVVQQVYIKP